MIEIISAKKYYGSHATGVVVLVNGQPRHFTGKTARAEANVFIKACKL